MDPPSESRIDSLHTATPNLADEPTLADGSPQNENGFLEDNCTKNYLCLSYSIYEKTFCEARVNLEVCSYLADKDSLADGPPG